MWTEMLRLFVTAGGRSPARVAPCLLYSGAVATLKCAMVSGDSS